MIPTNEIGTHEIDGATNTPGFAKTGQKTEVSRINTTRLGNIRDYFLLAKINTFGCGFATGTVIKNN